MVSADTFAVGAARKEWGNAKFIGFLVSPRHHINAAKQVIFPDDEVLSYRSTEENRNG
jgi:hypothetical protein